MPRFKNITSKNVRLPDVDNEFVTVAPGEEIDSFKMLDRLAIYKNNVERVSDSPRNDKILRFEEVEFTGSGTQTIKLTDREINFGRQAFLIGIGTSMTIEIRVNVAESVVRHKLHTTKVPGVTLQLEQEIEKFYLTADKAGKVYLYIEK